MLELVTAAKIESRMVDKLRKRWLDSIKDLKTSPKSTDSSKES